MQTCHFSTTSTLLVLSVAKPSPLGGAVTWPSIPVTLCDSPNLGLHSFGPLASLVLSQPVHCPWGLLFFLGGQGLLCFTSLLPELSPFFS